MDPSNQAMDEMCCAFKHDKEEELNKNVTDFIEQEKQQLSGVIKESEDSQIGTVQPVESNVEDVKTDVENETNIESEDVKSDVENETKTENEEVKTDMENEIKTESEDVKTDVENETKTEDVKTESEIVNNNDAVVDTSIVMENTEDVQTSNEDSQKNTESLEISGKEENVSEVEQEKCHESEQVFNDPIKKIIEDKLHRAESENEELKKYVNSLESELERIKHIDVGRKEESSENDSPAVIEVKVSVKKLINNIEKAIAPKRQNSVKDLIHHIEKKS